MTSPPHGTDDGDDADASIEADGGADAESTPTPAPVSSGAPDRDPNARDDELLADPPQGDHHRGRLGGYQHGARQRRWLNAAMIVALIASVGAGYYYLSWMEETGRNVDYYRLPPGSDIEGRSRVITWSSGKARLGLRAEPPGATTIELPDRTIRLKEGSVFAQLRVNVVDGRTVELTVLVGDITQEPKTPPAP